MTDKEKIREEVRKIARSINPYIPDDEGKNSEYESGRFAMVTQIMQIIDSMQEEPVSEDLEEYINELSKQFSEVSFAKLSRIAVRVAKWQKSNLWKPADGDDLPEINREVISLLNDGKVVFAHRPYKGKYIGKNLTTGNIETFENETYDEGGWNIPDVKWWLDCNMDSILKGNA